ncbi:MAG: CIA30 family protein [Shewanella sp.]|nr:CIA30 family protein [Shewanella sp.]MCF1431760.1 CIA30 family protein [Shewanella sp.]MCF1438756.1 CIA30 family protein [Shewanella sp.]MCF1456253.1 CIA30 family protein [Shewanella sp.]
MLLFDFSTLDTVHGWYSINDAVMGGLSRSRLSASSLGFGIFSGHVSLADGGGFASVGCDFQPKDLSDFAALRLLVKGDGKQYKVNLRDSFAPGSPVFQQVFSTREDDGLWQQVDLPLAGFVAYRRGQRVLGVELNLSAISGAGLVIADKQGGDFTLHILSIEVV